MAINRPAWCGVRVRPRRARTRLKSSVICRKSDADMTRVLRAIGVIAFVLVAARADACRAQTLTGAVSSAEEGAMEGVLVSAQKDGSPITVTVVSDASGRFRFPDGRLSAGHYALRIRAVGYDLAGPQDFDFGAAPANVAITLKRTADLAAQLTNTE